MLDTTVALIILNTMLSGAAGMICAGVVSWRRTRTNKVEVLINGSLGGLVSITAVCNAVEPVLAIRNWFCWRCDNNLSQLLVEMLAP